MTRMSDQQERDLQNGYLSRFRRDGQLVAVWLVSGKRLVGHIRGYDRFTIILEHGGGEHVVFKHAIATIGPVKDTPREQRD
jgi:host factor-I protein